MMDVVMVNDVIGEDTTFPKERPLLTRCLRTSSYARNSFAGPNRPGGSERLLPGNVCSA
jgi:hypothetical protein